MKKFYKHIILICSIIFLSITGNGAIIVMTLTEASPTTLSSGPYYLAGMTYDFSVQVVDPTLTQWGDVTTLALTIPNTTNITATIGPLTGTGTFNAATQGGTASTIQVEITGTWNNLTAVFHVPISWVTTVSSTATSRTIQADATTTGGSATRTSTYNYGVCADMRVLNFMQTGIAADGYVNSRTTTAFNVGDPAPVLTLVYDIPGAQTTDVIRTDSSFNSELYIDTTTATTITGGAGDATPVYTVNVSTLSAPLQTALHGSHSWYIRITNGTYGNRMSVNSLAITCDEVEIQSVEVINVLGRQINPSPGCIFFASTNVAATKLRVTARMRYTLGPMLGDTTITIYDNSGTALQYDVTITSGDTVGEVTMDSPPNVYPPTSGAGSILAGTTADRVYTPTSVTGGLTDSDQNTASEIVQPGNGFGAYTIIRWENNDPPGANTPFFTTFGTESSTAETLTLTWTAINNPVLNDSDGDFDSYKIYYRVNGTTIWTIVDRNTAGFATLGNAGTSSVNILGLQPLQTYDYMISAVDIFGNEVAAANILPGGTAFGSYATQPSSTIVTISDGIYSNYWDPSILGPEPPIADYSFRRSAIRIDLDIVTAGTTPDSVTLLVANNASDGATDLITDLPATEITTIICSRTAPNRWTGYLSTTADDQGAALINIGTTIRFIIRLTYGVGEVYYDSQNELTPPGEWYTREFRFTIANEPVFTPWPTRMLNNVITDDNPVTYPSYYLTDDAYVTITAYDIKGRPVAMLLENAYRPAGQNIKEGGWAGTNKNKKKLGVGLYYIRILAKRASDGKVIIDKYSKIVVAK